MGKRKILDELKTLNLGDLVQINWADASIGKSSDVGTNVDLPVQSWGIFIGVLGQKNKHIIIAQNNFRYADGIYDLDYTAIPMPWSAKIDVIIKNHIPRREAQQLLNSFMMGGRRRRRTRTKQQRVKNHHDRLG
jgi:hypothetical protein